MDRGLRNREVEVREFIVENFRFGEDSGITADASLMQEGIIDSTGLLELIMFLEETYGISIADEELVPENLDTIQNIDRFVSLKVDTCEVMAGTVKQTPSPSGKR
jgi:acyl carrier protein